MFTKPPTAAAAATQPAAAKQQQQNQPGLKRPSRATDEHQKRDAASMMPPPNPKHQQQQQRSKQQQQRKQQKQQQKETPSVTSAAYLDQAASITDLTPNDVLLGRGAPLIRYAGNVQFRTFVQTRMPEYRSCRRRHRKDNIAREIVAQVKNCGGRFLTRCVRKEQRIPGDTPGGKWCEAEDSVVLDKVKQAFRDNSCKEAWAKRTEKAVRRTPRENPAANHSAASNSSTLAFLGSGEGDINANREAAVATNNSLESMQRRELELRQREVELELESLQQLRNQQLGQDEQLTRRMGWLQQTQQQRNPFGLHETQGRSHLNTRDAPSSSLGMPELGLLRQDFSAEMAAMDREGEDILRRVQLQEQQAGQNSQRQRREESLLQGLRNRSTQSSLSAPSHRNIQTLEDQINSIYQNAANRAPSPLLTPLEASLPPLRSAYTFEQLLQMANADASNLQQQEQRSNNREAEVCAATATIDAYTAYRNSMLQNGVNGRHHQT